MDDVTAGVTERSERFLHISFLAQFYLEQLMVWMINQGYKQGNQTNTALVYHAWRRWQKHQGHFWRNYKILPGI